MVNNTSDSCDDGINATAECKLDTGILAENHVYTAIFVLIVLAVLIGNLLVVVVYYRKESLRTLGNFLTMQLVYADMSTAVGIVYHIYTLYIPNLNSNSLFCVTKYAVLFFPITITNFLLVLLSFDRYLTIVRPFQHDEIMTKNVVYGVVFLCWVLAAFLTGVCPIIFKLNSQVRKPELCAMIIGVTPEFLGFIGLPTIVLSMVIIIAIYAVIYSIVRKKTKKNHIVNVKPSPSNQPSCSHMENAQNQETGEIGDLSGKQELKKKVKTFRTLGLILGSFVGFWSPFVIALIIDISLELPPDHAFGIVRGLLGMVGMFNAITNPFIYAKQMADFRAEFGKILCRQNKVQNMTNSVGVSGTSNHRQNSFAVPSTTTQQF